MNKYPLESRTIINIVSSLNSIFDVEQRIVQKSYKDFVKYCGDKKRIKQTIDLAFYFIQISNIDYNKPDILGIQNIKSITNRDIKSINKKKIKSMIEDNKTRIISQKTSFIDDLMILVNQSNIDILATYNTSNKNNDLQYIKKIRYFTRQINRMLGIKSKMIEFKSFEKVQSINKSNKYQYVIDSYKEYWNKFILSTIESSRYQFVANYILQKIVEYYKNNYQYISSLDPITRGNMSNFINY